MENTVTTDLNRAIEKPPQAGLSSLWERLRARPSLLALAAALLVLGWAYAPNLYYLYTIWNNEPNYSHGFLVLPIALVIVWRRLSDSPVDWTLAAPSLGSLALLVLILAARTFAYERGSQWLESATLIPAIGCLLLAFGGWPLVRRTWPAVVFLIFMLPLPKALNDLVALPLQRVATTGSSFLLQATGLWVVPEGNTIKLETPHGMERLEVALACNGLSMLMTLAATVTATVILVSLPVWKRIVILLSAVPVALVCNILRIWGTGWCYYLIEGTRAKHIAHDWSGYLMMPLALLMVGLELLVLSWLADESDLEAEGGSARPIPPVYLGSGGKKRDAKLLTDDF